MTGAARPAREKRRKPEAVKFENVEEVAKGHYVAEIEGGGRAEVKWFSPERRSPRGPIESESLGNKLHAARQPAELDMRELANATGTSHGHLSPHRAREHIPRREMFESIADALAQDPGHRQELLDALDAEEMVDRFGIDRGVASLALQIGRGELDLDQIRAALDPTACRDATGTRTRVVAQPPIA